MGTGPTWFLHPEGVTGHSRRTGVHLNVSKGAVRRIECHMAPHSGPVQGAPYCYPGKSNERSLGFFAWFRWPRWTSGYPWSSRWQRAMHPTLEEDCQLPRALPRMGWLRHGPLFEGTVKNPSTLFRSWRWGCSMGFQPWGWQWTPWICRWQDTSVWSAIQEPNAWWKAPFQVPSLSPESRM